MVFPGSSFCRNCKPTSQCISRLFITLQTPAKHTFGMYLDGQRYELQARADSFDPDDPVARLDVSILQNIY
jgi:uncharacterized protein (DUF1015 family)